MQYSYIYDPVKNIMSRFEGHNYTGCYTGDPADEKLQEAITQGADISFESFPDTMARVTEYIKNEIDKIDRHEADNHSN